MDYPQTQCSQDGGLDLDLAGFERSTDFACTQIDEELNSQLELGIPHATAHTRLLDGQSNGPNNKVTSIGTVRDSLSDLVGAQDYTAGAESESDEEGIDMVFQATQTISNTSRPVYPGGSPNKTSDLHVNCDDSYNVPCENPKDPAIDVCTPENGKDKCDGDTWSDSECDSASEGIDLAILSTQPAAKEARTKCSDNLDNGDFFNAEEDLAPIPDSTREQRVMLTLSTYNSQSQIKPARSPVPQMASATNNSISPQFIDSDVPTQIDCAELVHLNRPVVNSVPVSDGETKRIQENSPTQSPVLFTRDLGSANGGNYTNTCSHTVFPSHLEIRIVAGKGAAMNETKNEKKHVAFAPEVDTSKSAEIFNPQSYQESESSGADWLEIGKEATSLSCKPKQTNRANEIDRTPIRKFCTTFNTRKSPTDKYQSNEIHNIFPVIPTTQEDDSPHLHHSFRRLKRRFGDGTSPVNRERKFDSVSADQKYKDFVSDFANSEDYLRNTSSQIAVAEAVDSLCKLNAGGQDTYMCSKSTAGFDRTSASAAAYIPEQLYSNFPARFADLWKALQEKRGWYWKKGKGLVDFYYIKPGCAPQEPFVLGVDYFTSEDALEKYVRYCVQTAKSFNLSSRTVQNEAVAEPNSKLFLMKDPCVNDLDLTPVGSDDDSSFDSASSIGCIALTDTDKDSLKNKKNIMKLSWPELWKVLRAKGWSWDFGSGLVDSWYFTPNHTKFNSKLGKDKFASEKAVRLFILNHLGEYPELMDANFIHTSLEKKNAATIGEKYDEQISQSISQSLPLTGPAEEVDSEWMLSSHRKKRKTTNSSNFRVGAENTRAEIKYVKESYEPSCNSSVVSVEEYTQQQLPSTSSRKQSVANLNGKNTLAQFEVDRAAETAHNEEWEAGNEATNKSAGTKKSSVSTGIVTPAYCSPFGRRIGKGGGIFARMRFVLCGLDEQLKTSIGDLLKRHDGKVLSSVKADCNDNLGTGHNQKNYRISSEIPNERLIVLSEPTEWRKPNYLMGLATGCIILHYSWAVDSSKAKKSVPYQNYLLPTGFSAVHFKFVFKHCDYESILQSANRTQVLPRNEFTFTDPAHNEINKKLGLLLNGVHIANYAGKHWEELLVAVGATVIAPQLDRKDYNRDNKIVPSINLILVNTYEYAEVCAGKLKSQSMSIDETSFVEKCMQQSTSRREPFLFPTNILKLEKQVVSTEWLALCVGLCELYPPNLLEVFSVPSNPVKHPFAYKCPAKKGHSQLNRYEIYDYVRYHAEQFSIDESTLCVGQIVQFTRRSASAPMMVKLAKMRILPPGTTNKCSLPQLVPTGEATVLAASQIEGKVVLLSKEVSEVLLYCKDRELNGSKIFALSEELETQTTGRVKEILEASDLEATSQDY